MKQQVLSYQIADSIDIKQFRPAFTAELVYSDSDELFFRTDPDRLVYVFKYGVVCFLNYDELRITEFLHLISPYCRNRFAESLTEEFEIETHCTENRFLYNSISIIGSDPQVIRLVMLNVAQSVALDYYYDQTTRLLEETNAHTQALESRGSLNISGRNLKRYIGKTLLLKNRIAENLYIFDSPPEVWDDEDLNRIDVELKRTFDLQERFRNIQEGLNIVRDNLELFRALMQHRYSNMLEWIIIILILVEVINVFVEKLFP